MVYKAKHDVPTMVSNFRKDRCTNELINLLSLAKNLDLNLLKAILPEITAAHNYSKEGAAEISKNIHALLVFCKTIQNVE